MYQTGVPHMTLDVEIFVKITFTPFDAKKEFDTENKGHSHPPIYSTHELKMKIV